MKLSKFQDVVIFAIKKEDEAIKGYENMIKIAKMSAVKQLVQELQDEERNHKKLLRGLTEGKIESYEPHNVIDLKISDTPEEEKLDADIDFQGLLIHAAKEEQRAVELYSHLRKLSPSRELRKLFDFLIEQERSHKLKLETEYEKHVLQED